MILKNVIKVLVNNIEAFKKENILQDVQVMVLVDFEAVKFVDEYEMLVVQVSLVDEMLDVDFQLFLVAD